MNANDMKRADVVKEVKAALKRRSGKAWRVSGGRGTGWCYIHIGVPPKRYAQEEEELAELHQLLSLDKHIFCNPVSFADWDDLLKRANGL